jgi:hypothetical protein
LFAAHLLVWPSYGDNTLLDDDKSKSPTVPINELLHVEGATISLGTNGLCRGWGSIFNVSLLLWILHRVYACSVVECSTTLQYLSAVQNEYGLHVGVSLMKGHIHIWLKM